MAKTFCIPPDLSAKLKAAAVKGEFSIPQLYEMSSDQRRAVFTKYTDRVLGKEINAQFEAAMISKQQGALKKWVEKTMSVKGKNRVVYRDVVAKINDLNELGVLDPASSDDFLADLVATKLGATVTEAEVKVINEKAARLQKLAEKPKNQFGMPDMEYFQAHKEMDDYLNSLVPASRIRVATSTIGRGTMLFSVKSPITNIIGNTEQAILTSFERRLTGGQVAGANNDLALEYVKYARDVFKKTGYDITRINSISEGRKTLGEEITHSQGKGAIRAIGRFYEDVVFKRLMSAPDIAFSAVHFADSANLASTKLAKKEGLKGAALKARAREIFADASGFEPATDEGVIVRAQAIADAEYSTYQNKSYYSTFAMGIRSLLNSASGEYRLGDQLMPFVKTPANVIGAGLDFAGVGAIRGLYTLPKAMRALKEGDPAPMRESVKGMVRSGIGVTGSFILANMIDPSDFIGEYPTTEKERQLLEMKNASTNSIRVGDKWISLDYFGALGASFIGFMYARKYGDSLPDAAYRYAQGVGVQSLKIPGFEQLYDTIKSAKEIRPEGDSTLAESVTGLQNFAVDYVRARVIPAIVYDYAKGTDPVQRETKSDTDALAPLKGAIPGLRQTLPVKKDAAGQELAGEGLISTVMFGARVKTAPDSPLVNEMIRLNEIGEMPALSDVGEKIKSMKSLKAQIGEEKFEEALDFYGQEYKDRVENLISADFYDALPDDKKKALIDKQRKLAINMTLIQYNFDKSLEKIQDDEEEAAEKAKAAERASR